MEWFDHVDEEGRVIGVISREEAHRGSFFLHPVVHCHVINSKGELLLQKRHHSKDIQPGKWDTSVGGHLHRGETVEEALRRELAEEIGLDLASLTPRFLYRYVMQSDVERELVYTYRVESEGPFHPQEEEIEELRFWSREEIERALGKGVFTPNFEEEISRFWGCYA